MFPSPRHCAALATQIVCREERSFKQHGGLLSGSVSLRDIPSERLDQVIQANPVIKFHPRAQKDSRQPRSYSYVFQKLNF